MCRSVLALALARPPDRREVWESGFTAETEKMRAHKGSSVGPGGGPCGRAARTAGGESEREEPRPGRHGNNRETVPEAREAECDAVRQQRADVVKRVQRHRISSPKPRPPHPRLLI